jgi:hypothetical protein
MRGAFAAGASGYLLWHVTKEARDQYDRPRTGDPVLDELADVADGLGRTATNCRVPRSKLQRT